MDSRYRLIEASNSRNYKQDNANCQDKYIPLFVLVIDGIDKVAGDIKYGSFFENLECLVMKSRAAGIQVVALINDLTAENKKLYARFSPPINVLRNGFFMKDATNLIMNTFARKGYYPKISISNDEGIRIIISIEIADHPIFFSYDYDDRALTYALNFSYEGELAMDKHLEILRIFDSDESKCFDSFQDDYYNGYLSLMGRRWDFDITVEFIEQIIDEISRLNVIKKLNEISHNEV